MDPRAHMQLPCKPVGRCDCATLQTAISRLRTQTHTSRAQSFVLRGGPAWPGCAQWMLQFSAKEGHGKVPNCRVGGGVQLGQAPCPPDALQIANYIFQAPPINLLSEWVLFRETESCVVWWTGEQLVPLATPSTYPSTLAAVQRLDVPSTQPLDAAPRRQPSTLDAPR